jgi:hypothetical protein
VRGVASATDNGSTATRLTAKITKVCCQPYESISATATGEYRNCPNEPAAVPKPKATERHSFGNISPKAARITGNEQPASPNPTSTPAEASRIGALVACDIRTRPAA